MFKRPPITTVAAHELYQAQRDLLAAESHLEYLQIELAHQLARKTQLNNRIERLQAQAQAQAKVQAKVQVK